MKPEFQKVINLFEELQVAGETVSLTILSREGKPTIKLQLESPPSPSSTTTPPTPAAPTPAPGGRRRRHRGAAARARRRQRAADHQGTTLAVPASASPLPPAPGVASNPAGPQHAPPPDTAPLLPPPPLPNPVPTRRLVTVISRRRANTWSSFNQLDGATEEAESLSEARQGDGSSPTSPSPPSPSIPTTPVVRFKVCWKCCDPFTGYYPSTAKDPCHHLQGSEPP